MLRLPRELHRESKVSASGLKRATQSGSAGLIPELQVLRRSIMLRQDRPWQGSCIHRFCALKLW